MNNINLYPTECNICDGKVVYVSNSKIYGKTYGSGYCYLCTKCGAYVGTHEPRPKEALGILANKEMRDKKMKCHEIFDSMWKSEKTGKARHTKRVELYRKLADELNLSTKECHFGYFDLEILDRAYKILQRWEIEKSSRKI